MHTSYRIFGLLCYLIGFAPLTLCAQLSIIGQVTSAGKPVGGARVDLRRDSVSAPASYTFTDVDGRYSIRTAQQGRWFLHVKALSYVPSTNAISLDAENLVFDIDLLPGGVERLQEVLVHAKRPHRIGQDTIELRAQAFLQGDERTVEDLLRKIPGLTVGTDGSIKVGDKEVEKVMVEGDDFFEKGYRLLTQNMSVHPLEKVQVLKRYSNNKHLKGIENSDKVALNLALKEDSKSQWLGSVSLSGTVTAPLYYYASLNLMNFGKKNKYFLLATANNNGQDAVSSINHLLYTTQEDEPGQIGIGVKTPTLIDYTPDLPGFDYRRTNFNQDKLLSFNSILNPSPKLKVKWLAFLNPTKKSFYRNRIQAYQVQDIQFTNTEGYELHKHLDNYFSKLTLQYDFHRRSTLTYDGSFGALGRRDAGNLDFNGSATTELIETRGYLTSHNLTHTYKLSDREALISSARYNAQHSPLNYSINAYYYEDLFGISDVSDVYQKVENDLHYLGFTSHYVRRQRNNDFFQLSLTHELQQQDLLTDFVLRRQAVNDRYTPDFSNQVAFQTNNTSLMTQYAFKRGRWEWVPSVRMNMLHSQVKFYQEKRHNSNLLLAPRLLTRYMLYRKGILEADLLFQQRNTEVLELLPNYYSTGFRNFTKGLGELATLSHSAAALNYTHGHMVDRFFANLSVGYNRQFDYLSYRSSLDVNFNLNEQILLKNKSTAFYKAQLNYYVHWLQGNFRLDLGANFSDYETEVSGLGNRQIHSGSHDYGISYRSVWKHKLNIYTGGRLQWNFFESDVKNELKNTFAFLTILYQLADGLQANVRNEAYRFGDFAASKPKTYYFSDVSVSYDAKKIKSRFEVSAKNIFDNRQFTNATVTDTYSAVTTYRLLPRYLALSVDYNF